MKRLTAVLEKTKNEVTEVPPAKVAASCIELYHMLDYLPDSVSGKDIDKLQHELLYFKKNVLKVK